MIKLKQILIENQSGSTRDEKNLHSYEEFINLGRLQRNKPENAMLRVQKIMSGGVLNPVVESAGDIMHRMNDPNTFDSAGYEFVYEKVKRVIWYLSNRYGFEREFRENIFHNDTNYNELSAALLQYADEFKKLPVFNKAQKIVQDMCICIGNQKWQDALTHLKYLDKYLKTWKIWKSFAHRGLNPLQWNGLYK